MRFLVMVKASSESEAGKLPTKEQLEEMGAFNQEMIKAGVMLTGEELAGELEGRTHRVPKRKADRHRRPVRRSEGAGRRLLDHPGQVEGRIRRLDLARAVRRRRRRDSSRSSNSPTSIRCSKPDPRGGLPDRGRPS